MMHEICDKKAARFQLWQGLLESHILSLPGRVGLQVRHIMGAERALVESVDQP